MAHSDELQAYPRKLHHGVPDWVQAGAYFHIRIRVGRGTNRSLISNEVGAAALAAVRNYHERNRWQALLFLLMPDHAHALLAFPRESSMGRVVGEWKHYMQRMSQVEWRDNFFDHRIRNRAELEIKYAYIIRNPVVKGLCKREEDWPWVWKMPLHA